MYYTFHDDDAHYVAKHVYETTSVIKYWYGDHTTGLATTKLTNKAAESFLRDVLLNKHMRIEIWKFNHNEWQIVRRASPGNLQDVEDFLFSSTHMTSAPVVLAIKYSVSDDNKVSSSGGGGSRIEADAILNPVVYIHSSWALLLQIQPFVNWASVSLSTMNCTLIWNP